MVSGEVVGLRDGPVVGRRALANDLRRQRAAAGRTIEEVARHLECSPAKVSRMETGAVKVGLQDLRALLEFYEVAVTTREELFALARVARQRGWWQAFTDVVPPGSDRFLGLEDGAITIGQHSTSLVPGLLQTRDYAAALIGSVPGIDPGLAARRVELRRRRQQLLQRADPPRLQVVLDEAVLWRRIGENEVFAAQLRHLLAMSERPGVDVRVVPFTAATHPGLGVSFTVFGLDPGGTDIVVFREALDANSFLDDPADVAVYTAALAAAAAVAVSPVQSHELVRARLAAVEAGVS